MQHVRDEFAMIIWTSVLDDFTPDRDRFGVKPLVYACHNGQLFLAPEAKALFTVGLPAGRHVQEANMRCTLPDSTICARQAQLASICWCKGRQDPRSG